MALTMVWGELVRQAGPSGALERGPNQMGVEGVPHLSARVLEATVLRKQCFPVFPLWLNAIEPD